MNRKAIISGREYALLEIVPSLDGGRALLLCEDENGKRAVCSEPLWRSCALTDVQSAPVHAHSSSQEKIEYFLSVFKGREDVYARRYHSTTTGKNGCEFVCRMRKGAPGSWKKRERPENGLKPGFLGRKRPGKSGKSADFTT